MKNGMEKTATLQTLEDVCSKLPPTFTLSIWGGRPSCSNGDDENPIRTQHNTFFEAALLMLMEIEKK